MQADVLGVAPAGPGFEAHLVSASVTLSSSSSSVTAIHFLSVVQKGVLTCGQYPSCCRAALSWLMTECPATSASPSTGLSSPAHPTTLLLWSSFHMGQLLLPGLRSRMHMYRLSPSCRKNMHFCFLLIHRGCTLCCLHRHNWAAMVHPADFYQPLHYIMNCHHLDCE